MKTEHDPSHFNPDSPRHFKRVVGQVRDMRSSQERTDKNISRTIKVRVIEPWNFLKMCPIMSKAIISQMRKGLIIGPTKKERGN